jgi:hypothetical protein
MVNSLQIIGLQAVFVYACHGCGQCGNKLIKIAEHN